MSSIQDALKKARLQKEAIERQGILIHRIGPPFRRKGVFRRPSFILVSLVLFGGMMAGLFFRNWIETSLYAVSSGRSTAGLATTEPDEGERKEGRESISSGGPTDSQGIGIESSKPLNARGESKYHTGSKEGRSGISASKIKEENNRVLPDEKDRPRGKDAYTKAMELSRKGDTDGAISYYILATEGPEPVMEAFLKLGDIYYEKKGDPERASIYYLKAINANPRDHKAHNNLGTCYLKKGDIKGAKEEFLRAIELKADFSVAYYNMACVKAMEKDYIDSLSWLKKAISHSPQCIEWAMEDPDLDGIKDLEGFKELVRNQKQ